MPDGGPHLFWNHESELQNFGNDISVCMLGYAADRRVRTDRRKYEHGAPRGCLPIRMVAPYGKRLLSSSSRRPLRLRRLAIALFI